MHVFRIGMCGEKKKKRERAIRFFRCAWKPAHPCLCMRFVHVLRIRRLVAPTSLKKEAKSDWTDSLFPNTSVWPAASHTFQYFQTGFQKRELKGIGVVKTWHSQKRAAGPRDYQETSHMTQCCRNDSTARVTDEGLVIDIVMLLLFPLALCLSFDSPVIVDSQTLDNPEPCLPFAQGHLSSSAREGQALFLQHPNKIILVVNLYATAASCE